MRNQHPLDLATKDLHKHRTCVTRESPTTIANRIDSYADAARGKGFVVEHDFSKAAGVADGLLSNY